MMTIQKLLAGTAMLTLTSVCTTVMAQQQPFSIEGQMGKDQNGMLKFRYSNNNADVSDSVKVNNGTFRFDGQLNEPSIGTMVFIPDDKNIQGQFKEIYIDPNVNMTIKGSGNLLSTQVNGGQSQKDLEELFAQYKPLLEKGPALDKQLKEYQEAGDDDNVKRVAQELGALRTQRRDIQTAFANSHPNSFVAFALWTRSVDGFIQDPIAAETEFNKFSPAIRNSPTAKKLAARFVVAKKLVAGNTAPDFTLNDINGKAISLSSLKGKNVMLFFWSRNFVPFEPFSFGVNKISRQCKEDNLVLLNVYCDADDGRWQTAVQEAGFSAGNIINVIHPVHMEGDADKSKLSQQYDLWAGAVPHTFLIGTDGKILVRNVDLIGDPVVEIKNHIKK